MINIRSHNSNTVNKKVKNLSLQIFLFCFVLFLFLIDFKIMKRQATDWENIFAIHVTDNWSK